MKQHATDLHNALSEKTKSTGAKEKSTMWTEALKSRIRWWTAADNEGRCSASRAAIVLDQLRDFLQNKVGFLIILEILSSSNSFCDDSGGTPLYSDDDPALADAMARYDECIPGHSLWTNPLQPTQIPPQQPLHSQSEHQLMSSSPFQSQSRQPYSPHEEPPPKKHASDAATSVLSDLKAVLVREIEIRAETARSTKYLEEQRFSWEQEKDRRLLKLCTVENCTCDISRQELTHAGAGLSDSCLRCGHQCAFHPRI